MVTHAADRYLLGRGLDLQQEAMQALWVSMGNQLHCSVLRGAAEHPHFSGYILSRKKIMHL